MPFTFQEEVSNGVQTVYPIDFDFRDKNTVYVYKGAHHENDLQLSYRWLGDSIELTNLSELEQGQRFYIRRVVDKVLLTHVFENTGIRGKFVDDANYQLLYVAQEFADGFLTAGEFFQFKSGLRVDGNLVMNGHRVMKVGNAVLETDAVNLGLSRLVAADAKGSRFVQEDMPVGMGQGSTWYKPSVPAMYTYYIQPDGSGQWVEDDETGEYTGVLVGGRFSQEETPPLTAVTGATWYKPSIPTTFVLYESPNGNRAWVEDTSV